MDQVVSQRLRAKSQRVPLPASRRAPASRPLSLSLDGANSAGRQEMEAFVAEKFEHQHGARIDHFLPYLLSLKSSDRPGAVVGLRPADESALFLERYLDVPVEQAISKAFMTPVDRLRVIEIGNLAASMPGTACALFAVLAIVLHQAGFRWVVCTATPQVMTMLNRIQFPSRVICEADAACLGDDASRWGNYYASRPQVIVGDTEAAAYRVASDRALSASSFRLAQSISRIATTLRTRA